MRILQKLVASRKHDVNDYSRCFQECLRIVPKLSRSQALALSARASLRMMAGLGDHGTFWYWGKKHEQVSSLEAIDTATLVSILDDRKLEKVALASAEGAYLAAREALQHSSGHAVLPPDIAVAASNHAVYGAIASVREDREYAVRVAHRAVTFCHSNAADAFRALCSDLAQLYDLPGPRELFTLPLFPQYQSPQLAAGFEDACRFLGSKGRDVHRRWTHFFRGTQTSEELAQTAKDWFQEYCVDFEPARSKLLLDEKILDGLASEDLLCDTAPAEDRIEYYSCFISHNSQNKKFARRLYKSLQRCGVRCWFDEKEIRAGDSIADEIDQGIRLWDKVILCCSRESLDQKSSWWIEHELEKAMKKERDLRRKRGEKVLTVIPVDLDGFVFSEEYQGAMKSEILSRKVADFANWMDPDAFKAALDELVDGLRADEGCRESPPELKL